MSLQDQLDDLARRGAKIGPPMRLPEPSPVRGEGRAAPPPAVKQARGRVRHEPGRMNKTEAAYAAHLETRKAAGEIADYWFEPWKFRLADRTYYTPDFVVMMPDGTLEIHETKGHWEDDARVKWKVAGSIFYLFRFVAVSKGRAGLWYVNEVKSG